MSIAQNYYSHFGLTSYPSFLFFHMNETNISEERPRLGYLKQNFNLKAKSGSFSGMGGKFHFLDWS
jgi:hypothetical protein